MWILRHLPCNIHPFPNGWRGSFVANQKGLTAVSLYNFTLPNLYGATL